MRMRSYRHISRSTGPRTLKKKSKKSDEQFLSFMSGLYELTGTEHVTGGAIIADGGIVGIFDAKHLYYDPFWILCEPGNPRNIKDRDIITIYGLRDRNGDFYKVADVFVHKPGTKIYEWVMSL